MRERRAGGDALERDRRARVHDLSGKCLLQVRREGGDAQLDGRLGRVALLVRREALVHALIVALHGRNVQLHDFCLMEAIQRVRCWHRDSSVA